MNPSNPKQTERLKAYVDGEMNPLSRWQMERELANDTVLRQEAQLYSEIGEAIRADETATPQFSETLKARILQEVVLHAPTPREVEHRRKAEARRRNQRWLVTYAGGCAAAVVAALFWVRFITPPPAPALLDKTALHAVPVKFEPRPAPFPEKPYHTPQDNQLHQLRIEVQAEGQAKLVYDAAHAPGSRLQKVLTINLPKVTVCLYDNDRLVLTEKR